MGNFIAKVSYKINISLHRAERLIERIQTYGNKVLLIEIHEVEIKKGGIRVA